MRKVVLLALVIAFVFALSPVSPAWAQPMPRTGGATGHEPGPGGSMGAQLTPEQQQTMQKIMNTHKPAFTKLHQRLWAKKIQLKAALTEDRINDSKVKALSGEINRLSADLFNEQVAMQVELSRAGLSYYALRGPHMMGAGMMGARMAGSCPMMGGDGDEDARGFPGE